MAETDPKDLVRRGYDALAARYDEVYGAETKYRSLLDELCRRIPAGGTVLDLGCGSGVPVARTLAAAGFRVTGVDISDVQISRARQRVPQAEFVRADATAIAFDPGRFDAVVSFFALIHVPVAEQPPLLRTIAGWLRPGGFFVTTMGHGEWTGTEQNWLGGGTPMWWSHADAATNRAWIEQSGLVVEREEFLPEGDGGHVLFWARRATVDVTWSGNIPVASPVAADMTELTDRTIAALRAEHDALVALVTDLDDDQLTSRSGADGWTVAQVFSHLGSGAEIGRSPIAKAAGDDVPIVDNQTIWARWDASAPAEQVAGFVEQNTRWLETVEALTSEQRSSLTVDLGFMPEPVPLVVALAMRLNEVANHAWDIRIALNPDAEVLAESAAVLIELLTGPLGFMLGWLAKPAELSGSAAVAVPGGGLVIEDAVTVVGTLDAPSATFAGSAGEFVRLLNGRLKEPYVRGVTVTGNTSLDDLHRVFPGY